MEKITCPMCCGLGLMIGTLIPCPKCNGFGYINKEKEEA